VPMLLSDEVNTFDKNKNPAFENCEAKYWLAYKNEKLVGRIAGIISRAYIERWKNKYARFGWIDFIDDENVSRSLIGAVEKWAMEKGMTAVHGPLGFTDFDPEGMLVEGFDEPGTMQTIYNFPYYQTHLEKLGYKKDCDWREYEIAVPAEVPEAIQQLAEEVLKKYDLHVLKVKNQKELLPFAKDIFDVLNEAYRNLYGVVPLSEKQISIYTKQYFSLIRPEYVSVVLDHNEKTVAFAIAIPSLSKALQKSGGKLFPFGFITIYNALRKNNIADLYLIGVRPDMQEKKLFSILTRELEKTFIENHVSKAITHPALENNNKVLALWKNYETRFTRRRRCYLKFMGK
jgi:hypothetical protein